MRTDAACLPQQRESGLTLANVADLPTSGSCPVGRRPDSSAPRRRCLWPSSRVPRRDRDGARDPLGTRDAAALAMTRASPT